MVDKKNVPKPTNLFNEACKITGIIYDHPHIVAVNENGEKDDIGSQKIWDFSITKNVFSLFLPKNNSGTYAYFKKAVIGKGGEYKLGSRDMHGSKDVVDLVEKTACAIGYSGLAYATSHIAMPCVKKTPEAECVAEVLDAELRVLREDDGADGLGQNTFLGLPAALGAHHALPSDKG